VRNINPDELRAFVEDNPKLVTRKESKKYPGLYVLKYGREVFHKNLWHVNDFLLECRGLVVDKDYNIIVKPFTKVFNYGENGTMIDRDEDCQWVRKVNGFLGVVTYDANISETDLIYSTTGSLDSDFVDLIAKQVDPMKEAILNTVVGRVGKFKTTLMFEICDPSDPHIVPEQEGAWLIGADFYINNSFGFHGAKEAGLDVIAAMIGAKRPESGYARFSDIVKMANECKHEGFMVYGTESNTALKIKSPYYLITKFLARAGARKLEIVLDGKQGYGEFDEEYYPLIDHLRANAESYKALEEQERIQLIREFLNKTNEK
jgi:hypothetical protein